MKNLFRMLFTVFAFVFLINSNANPLESLPALSANTKLTSISGLSSGAFMAVQYQVAYSESVIGSGIIAGGVYYCAGAFSAMYTSMCMGKTPFMYPNPKLSVMAAKQNAKAGLIDDVENLKSANIYIFSGTKDTVVKQPAVDSLVKFFDALGVNNLVYVNEVPAGHALISPGFPNKCSVNKAPYISSCLVNNTEYDQPGIILAHIYGTLNPKGKAISSNLIVFDQSEFTSSHAYMSKAAYVYVPTACVTQSCAVHIALHGCKQSKESVSNAFYEKASYNDWAESNNIIVLYPQVDKSMKNPAGCWDWFGYTGTSYATKNGPQLKAINMMVERLTANF